MLGGRAHTVVGVLPAAFENVLDPTSQIYRALGYASQEWACRSCRHLRMIGRLRDGVTHRQASLELEALMQRLAAEHPTTYRGAGAVVEQHPDPTSTGSQSFRSAPAGSIRAARTAGTSAATKATAMSTAPTPPNVRGSSAFVPK